MKNTGHPVHEIKEFNEEYTRCTNEEQNAWSQCRVDHGLTFIIDMLHMQIHPHPHPRNYRWNNQQEER